MVYIVKCENSVVTDYYLDIIGGMFSEYEKVEDYNEHILIDEQDIVIVARVIDFLKLYVKGYRKIVYWMQGIEAEESYFNHKSLIRKIVLDIMTKFALKRAKSIFYVSESMRKYEESKFGLYTGDKSFIMPCFNISENREISFKKKKYNKNTFVYVGSLSKWQCFEKTVDFYKKIEAIRNDAKLYVYTFQKEEAESILKDKGIKKYFVATSTPDKLAKELQRIKFGFVIRENIALNNVSTPTKLSTYLSAGVIPVFSKCLEDFYEKSRNMKYVIPIYNDIDIPKKLDEFLDSKISCEDIEEEYSKIFSIYYNPEYYKNKYSKKLYNLAKY